MLSNAIVSVDIELTNRCNANCSFCPRSETPHQGLMTAEVFQQSLLRAIEIRPTVEDDLGRELKISLCGLGEPLLSPLAVDAVRQVRAEGLDCAISSNGALLSADKGEALLDAGLTQINLNVGEEGDDYEEIYQLPFERTLENVVRFAEMAKGRCQTTIVLVDYKNDPAHLVHMKEFWRAHGLADFFIFPIMNRGGALDVSDMDFRSRRESTLASQLLADHADQPLCGSPFVFLFVGYDGQHYLCCADWRKEAALGSVFDLSFADVLGDKLAHIKNRGSVCKACNLDPHNELVNTLRPLDLSDPDSVDGSKLINKVVAWSPVLAPGTDVRGIIDALGPRPSAGNRVRRRIPVTAK